MMILTILFAYYSLFKNPSLDRNSSAFDLLGYMDTELVFEIKSFTSSQNTVLIFLNNKRHREG